MSSARKLVTAGVIAALSGSFPNTGVFAAPDGDDVRPAMVASSPSPMTTEELLSGMVIEEVEPGVVRVVNDGYRNLADPSNGLPWDCQRVIVGDNDQVWRAAAPCWRLYRLGQDEEWSYDREGVDLGWGRSFASLDGRLWALEAAGLSSFAPYYLRLFDDGAWVPDPRLSEASHGQMHVEDDGTLWLVGADGAIHWAGDASAGGAASAGSSSWADVWAGDPDRDGVSLLSVTDDAVAWLMTEAAKDGSVSFLRFDGTDWQVVPAPDGVGSPSATVGFPAGVSPDGVLWTAGDSRAPHRSLARFDEDGWTTFTEADGVQPWGGQRAWWNTKMDTLWVAPDGSAWVNASVTDIPAHGSLGCDGLARFDGESWQTFLPGQCISDLDFASDGSAWVVARRPQRHTVQTYVITPAAVTTPAEAAATFPAGEPIDLVFISDSSGSIVSERYAGLVGAALDREVRLDRSVDKDVEAIRTTFAEQVAGAEIIVFYVNSARFEQDMPAPTFEQGCIDPVDALTNPDYLEDPGYLGPPWTPGTTWETVAAVPAAEDWQPYRDFLSGIWEAIWEARDGRPVVLRGYDVYNPWFGHWVEIGVEAECTAIWEGQARTAREAAEANGAVFVSFYDVFNGPGHDEDAKAKGWIGEDGMHASEAGGAAAAEALAAAGFELSEPPREEVGEAGLPIPVLH